jgi:probable addiction module antidote protein
MGRRRLKLRKWYSAAHLETEADMARYWEACLEEGRDDPAFITAALGNIARARGMTGLARKTGLTREVGPRPAMKPPSSAHRARRRGPSVLVGEAGPSPTRGEGLRRR